MQTEREVKILDINIKDMQAKIESIGADFVKERHMKRFVYDFIPINPYSRIRLRDDGSKVTLTIKEIQNESISGTLENEIITDSFDKTHEILKKLGYVERAFQENKRISYSLKDINFEIDIWPNIPPYLEIEAKSESKVIKGLELLGYTMSDATSINTSKVYLKYGIDLDSIKILSFKTQ